MHEDRIARLGTLALFVGAALVYGSLALADFVWDDVPLVVQNSLTGDLANLPRFFSEDLWHSSGVEGHDSGYYRPLMLTSLAVDRALWGLSAAGHHLHSVAWHLGASAVLLVLLRRLVAPLPALLGTVVFTLHPLQSEAVAWIASRNDPMVATFVLAAVLVLLPRQCGRWRLCVGGVLVLAATLSKESGVLAPVLLVLLDLARWRRPGSMARYLAAGIALSVWFGLRQAAGVHLSELPDSTGVGLLLERGHLVLASYGKLLLVPWPLSTGRTLEWMREPPAHVLLGLVAVVGLAALLIRRGQKLGLAGLIFALVAVAPSLVAIAGKGQLGERYLYLPLVGLAIGLAASLPARGRWLLAGLPVALCWAYVLHLRLPEWQNALGLWEAAARDTPNGYAFTGYAHELNRAGRQDEAQAWFWKAIDDPPPMADACANVLRGPLNQGQDEQALVNARRLKGQGCEATPDFMAVLATVLARNCLWEEVLEVLPRAEGDRGERALVLAGAIALMQGEVGQFQILSEQAQQGPKSYGARVQASLQAGCRSDVWVP